MEIRHLKYFVSAAAHLNFTKAAQECFVVQSAMTQQIAALEKELGTALFERRGRSLVLTAEGEVFLTEAKKILEELDAAVDLTRSVSSGYHQTLRIGCQGNLMREELPRILKGLRQKHPEIKVLLSQGGVPELTAALENQQIDCMISLYWEEFQLRDWMKVIPFWENEVTLMVSADHPLAEYPEVTMDQIRKENFIQLNGNEKKNRLLQWAASGSPIKLYCWCDDQSCLETLVAAGYGVALCVKSARRPHSGLVYLPIKDLQAKEALCFSYHKKKKKKEGLHILLEEMHHCL